MYCTRCGTENTDGARFCTACGASTEPGAGAAGASGYAPGTGGATYSDVPPRRLRRVLKDKKIAGVCAGFAEYFDMDVTLMRLLWLALVLIPPFPAVLIYFVAWAILPRE